MHASPRNFLCEKVTKLELECIYICSSSHQDKSKRVNKHNIQGCLYSLKWTLKFSLFAWGIWMPMFTWYTSKYLPFCENRHPEWISLFLYSLNTSSASQLKWNLFSDSLTLHLKIAFHQLLRCRVYLQVHFWVDSVFFAKSCVHVILFWNLIDTA